MGWWKIETDSLGNHDKKDGPFNGDGPADFMGAVLDPYKEESKLSAAQLVLLDLAWETTLGAPATQQSLPFLAMAGDIQNALTQVRACYQSAWGRNPSRFELDQVWAFVTGPYRDAPTAISKKLPRRKGIFR